tara:strand:+ start:555 stop:908 length:354 start_codon:yes stop_codon:yes gene_type:complete
MELEVDSYKRSLKIELFNYDENQRILTILHKNLQPPLDQLQVDNILYVTAVIELLGLKYINMAILLNENVTMSNVTMTNAVSKYIKWQTHSGTTYTILFRKAYQIINFKYRNVKQSW